MKNLKLLFFLLTFSFCSQSSEMTMGMPEPYFGGTEDMAFSETSLSRDGSFSQGDYIIKTAYASTDVSSSNFENTIDEVEDLVKNYNGNISNTYLSTNYQGLKSYNLTMNIPAEEFESFLLKVEEISKFSFKLKDLLKFLNVPWSEDVSQFYKTAEKRGIISTPSYNQVNQPIYSNSMYRWKNYEKEFVNSKYLLDNWVKEFNY